MGMSRGFDVARNLTKEDQAAYDEVINDVRQAFKNDKYVFFGPRGFSILQGEIPSMPYDCTLFRRFDSKYSGHYAANVEFYIDKVQAIFTQHMGDNMAYHWDEAIDDGFYLNDTLLDEDTIDEQSGVRDPRTVRGREWEYETGYHQTRADDIPKHLNDMMEQEAAVRLKAYEKELNKEYGDYGSYLYDEDEWSNWDEDHAYFL